MNYGKIVNGELQIAGSMIRENGREYYNPSEKIKKAAGYLPVIETAQPVKEGFYFSQSWQEADGQIIQVWTEHAIEEAVNLPAYFSLKELQDKVLAQGDEIERLKSAQIAQAEKITLFDATFKSSDDAAVI